MRTTSLLGALAALLLLAGCGGGTGPDRASGSGELTGIVFDPDGKSVANAHVFVDSGRFRETYTNSAGRYVLRDVPDRDVTVHAEFQASSSDPAFLGENLGQSFDGKSTPNVNIALYPASQVVTLKGQARNGAGGVLGNVRVVVRPVDHSLLSSATTITDEFGDYSIGGLASGVAYQVVGSALGSGDFSVTKTIPASPSDTERTQDLLLSPSPAGAPAKPLGVKAVAFTTPADVVPLVRGARNPAGAYEAIKRLRDPSRAARLARLKARDTVNGQPISIDVTWNEYPPNPTIRPAGFIIDRHASTGEISDYDLADPLAVLFSDSDGRLVENVTYTYTVQAVSTNYDSSLGTGASPVSDAASAKPLGDLALNAPSGRTINWQGGSGSDNYTVYVYKRYPDIYASDARVATKSALGSATSVTVNDVAVVSGLTYYYVVVGARTDGTAETYSPVGTFTP